MSDATIKAARTFAEKLRQSEPIAAFRRAKARLDADHQAQELLAKLSERQRALALKQRTGEITRGEVADLRRLQQEAENQPVIGGYIEAQQQAQLFLPTVNATISDLLGFDFGSLARIASP